MLISKLCHLAAPVPVYDLQETKVVIDHDGSPVTYAKNIMVDITKPESRESMPHSDEYLLRDLLKAGIDLQLVSHSILNVTNPDTIDFNNLTQASKIINSLTNKEK